MTWMTPRRPILLPAVLLTGLVVGSGGCSKPTKPTPSAPPSGPSLATAANAKRSRNNLAQIGIALQSYHDANGTLPPFAICDKKGKRLLSWRVAILPYILEEKLYQEFKLDEPWDSPHNKKLIARMPKVYALPGAPKGVEGTTHYRVFVGVPGEPGAGLTAFNAPLPDQPPTPVKLKEISDGAENTVLVAEALDPVIWTKPEELSYTVDAPLPALGYYSDNRCHVLLADGKVREIKRGTPESAIRALISRAGGEAIPEGTLE